MKKNSQTYLVVLLVTVSLLSYLFFTKKVNSPSEENISQSPQTSQTITPTDTDTKSDYQDFNPQDFEQNRSKRRVLFFYANWCTTCRPVNADFLKNQDQIPDDVIVFRVNYKDSDTDKSEKELAEKYKIIYQHTFVQVNQQGDEIKKWNGGNLSDLIKNVN